MKVRGILRGLVGVIMIGGFLAQMWHIFEQFISELKTVAVSFEERRDLEFPSLAFCDSRAFKKKFVAKANATVYNVTTFNVDKEVSMSGLIDIRSDHTRALPTNTYTTELLPTPFNGFCKLYEFKQNLPPNTLLSKSQLAYGISFQFH